MHIFLWPTEIRLRHPAMATVKAPTGCGGVPAGTKSPSALRPLRGPRHGEAIRRLASTGAAVVRLRSMRTPEDPGSVATGLSEIRVLAPAATTSGSPEGNLPGAAPGDSGCLLCSTCAGRF